MKPEHFRDEGLSKVLGEWRVSASLAPRFQEQVWNRIECTETRESLLQLILRRVSAAMARPSLAVSYIAILLFLGLAAGYWQAQAANAHAEQMLSSRYVQLMNPYQSSHH